MPLFKKASQISISARAVFACHKSPDSLRSLIPPWERVKIERAPASLAEGGRDLRKRSST